MKLRPYPLRRARVRALAVVASGFLLWASAAVVANADSFKPYTISGLPGQSVQQSPDAVSLTLTVPGTSQQQLGSFEVGVPVGFSISVTGLTQQKGVSASTNTSGSLALFQNLNVQPGGPSVVIYFTLTAPCGTNTINWTAGPPTSTSGTLMAQQANQWNSTNNANNLTLAQISFSDPPLTFYGSLSSPYPSQSTDPALSSTYQGLTSCAIKFLGTPNVAIAQLFAPSASPIAYEYLSMNTPSGPGVQVEVYNANTGAPAQNVPVAVQLQAAGTVVSGSGPLVTIDSASSPTVGTDVSSVTVSTGSDGVATFSNLGVDAVGAQYSLLATVGSASGPGPSIASNTFQVVPTITACVPTGSSGCSADYQPNSNTDTNVQAPGGVGGDYFAGGSNPKVLTVSCDFAPFNYADDYDPNQTWVSFSGAGDKNVTLTILKSWVQNTPNNGLSFYQVCLAAPYQFNTGVVTGYGATGTGAVPIGTAASPTIANSASNNATDFFGQQWYVGTLPTCSSVTTGFPCITGTSGARGNRTLYFTLPSGPGDPYFR